MLHTKYGTNHQLNLQIMISIEKILQKILESRLQVFVLQIGVMEVTKTRMHIIGHHLH
jgi:hypothetical protein